MVHTMSAHTPAPTDDDDEWSSDSASSSEVDDALSGVTHGVQTTANGVVETLQSLLRLGLIGVGAITGRNGGSEQPTRAQQRAAKWDERAKPIQERFDDQNVDADDVKDAIEWARSQ